MSQTDSKCHSSWHRASYLSYSIRKGLLICWRELNPFKVSGEKVSAISLKLNGDLLYEIIAQMNQFSGSTMIRFFTLVKSERQMIYECAHISHMWFLFFSCFWHIVTFPIRSTLPFCYCVVYQKTGNNVKLFSSHNFSCLNFFTLYLLKDLYEVDDGKSEGNLENHAIFHDHQSF
jgi:hypothetical protein